MSRNSFTFFYFAFLGLESVDTVRKMFFTFLLHSKPQLDFLWVIYREHFPPTPPPDSTAVCLRQAAVRRGVFGPPPMQPLKIKPWKSPTVNIGLASATGRLGFRCAKVTLTVSTTALPSADSDAIQIGGGCWGHCMGPTESASVTLGFTCCRAECCRSCNSPTFGNVHANVPFVAAAAVMKIPTMLDFVQTSVTSSPPTDMHNFSPQ